MRRRTSEKATVPEQWLILDSGEKVRALKTFITHNVNRLYGLEQPKSGLATIRKGSVGRVMGMTSPTSLSSTHVAKFGNRYVLIYDYNFEKGELESLRR